MPEREKSSAEWRSAHRAAPGVARAEPYSNTGSRTAVAGGEGAGRGGANVAPRSPYCRQDALVTVQPYAPASRVLDAPDSYRSRISASSAAVNILWPMASGRLSTPCCRKTIMISVALTPYA
jgi:hypothetical protein